MGCPKKKSAWAVTGVGVCVGSLAAPKDLPASRQHHGSGYRIPEMVGSMMALVDILLGGTVRHY